ncbi:MAG: GGDEF domain-containing protein, partial [Actinobacteria bacterium]|nr:GGDEF domain-containing protein [Actinomycetota bacterium]
VFALVPLMLMTILDPAERVSLRYWAAGALAIGVASLLTALRDADGNAYVVVFANAIAVLGFGWVYIASRRLLGLPKGRRYVYLVAGVVFLASVLLESLLRQGTSEILLTSAALTVFPAASALIFSANRAELPPLVARVTAGIFWAVAAVYATRAMMALIWLLLSGGSPMFESSAIPYYLDLILNTWLGAMLALVVSARIQERLRTERDRVTRANERLRILSTTDALTGLGNRLQIDSILAEYADPSRPQHLPLSILMVDVDHFKGINDDFGHPAGDAVLRTVASTLRTEARADGAVGRWGGEEFVVILPDTDHAAARDYAEALRERVARHNFDVDRAVTVSVGVATTSVPPADTTELLRRADSALYTAKHSGRNRVAVG